MRFNEYDFEKIFKGIEFEELAAGETAKSEDPTANGPGIGLKRDLRATSKA